MAFVQALPRGQQRARAIGVDGAAFEREIDALDEIIVEQVHAGQFADQLVVAAGLELPAPTGEAEIEQSESMPLCLRHLPASRGGRKQA